jgi:hypothetical protein
MPFRSSLSLRYCANGCLCHRPEDMVYRLNNVITEYFLLFLVAACVRHWLGMLPKVASGSSSTSSDDIQTASIPIQMSSLPPSGGLEKAPRLERARWKMTVSRRVEWPALDE